MGNNVKYYLDAEGNFVIENYHLAKPFSSFFPGIAGVWGVPIWVFYVNRGQGIASFGIKDKDHPIMEFQPANKSYQQVSLGGFRTFIKVGLGRGASFYDAFHNGVGSLGSHITNKMSISPYELKIKEVNHTLGIEVDVEYFTIPGDNYGALCRKLVVKNLKRSTKNLEILDGMPQVIPYGLTNLFLKELPRTIEAWMGVENLENNIPFIRVKVDPTDRPEVIHVSAGNFYLCFSGGKLIRPIVDPESIFGHITDFTYPAVFLEKTKFSYPLDQLTRSKTPCCMSYKKATLKGGESVDIYSLAGNMSSLEKLRKNSKRIADKGYILAKRKENKELICNLMSSVATYSSLKNFDLYCRQNFLDNVMRGGYPLSLKCDSKNIHIQVYSRKHGDLERDYNKFLLEPTYFSQGNGNFRDVNQNRRSDIWFNPEIKDESIFSLFNLIQTDGYNPLVIKPDNFMFNKNYDILSKFFNQKDIEIVKGRLERPYTPGELLFLLEQNDIKSSGRSEEFIKLVLANSKRLLVAEHGEGFWVDHWTYCLDLLQTYLSLYPENLKNILIEKEEFTFFDNAEYVRPRKEKYFLKGKRVFQYHAVANNHAKHNMIRKRTDSPHVVRTKGGCGDIYTTTLLVKMLTLIANKFASLDPFGIGIEMEADKPNWYDSLNGLPGLLGSTTCETFELKRWIIFMRDSLKKVADNEYTINVPLEVYELLIGLKNSVGGNLNDYSFWDKSHTLKEDYRHKTLMGLSGSENQINVLELFSIFDSYLKKLDKGLKKAYDNKLKLYYSYFINEVREYETVSDSDHPHIIRPLKFKQIPLPLFLEGPMHYLRTVDNQEEAKKTYQALRKSKLFDKKLKMYKVTASLKDMPEEIGRCRVFVPGWLENESVWLHMEYKYILELLKNGLYKEFYEDFKSVLIPFQNPERYGRSILENSSFLVSSAFPQKKLHGNGFVARLSGSTAEFLSIWLFMCVGKEPFYLDSNGKLVLEFKPALPAWLFKRKDDDGFGKNTFAFKFLNRTLVVYHNPKRRDTFGALSVKAKEITLKQAGKPKISLSDSCISSPLSYDVREGKFERIDIVLG